MVNSQTDLSRFELKHGDHNCVFYEPKEELLSILQLVIRQGLERNEQIFFIGNEVSIELLNIYLEDNEINTKAHLDSGQVKIIDWNEFFSSKDGLDLSALMNMIQHEINQSVTKDYSGLQAIFEMGWINRSSDDIGQLRIFETWLDELTPSSRCISNCLYDVERFESEVLLDILHRHPKVAINKNIYANNLYIPPVKLEESDPKAARLKFLLQRIIECERLAEEINLQRIIDSKFSNSFVIISAKNNEILYSNDKVEFLFGYDRGELIGKPVSILNAHTDHQNPDEKMQEISDCLQRDGKWVGEVQSIKKDGTLFWVFVKSSLLDHPVHGKTYISIQVDVTDRIQVNKALIESENRYRELFNSVPVGLNITTPSGEYIDANNAVLEMLGYPDRETLLESKTLDEYIEIEDRERWQDELENHGHIQRYEVRMKKYDGTPIWVRVNSHAVKNIYDHVIYYQGSLEDITEQKNFAELLQKSEERFRNLFNAMADGIIFIDPDGQITLANPAAEDILGLERTEIQKRNFASPEWEILRTDGTPLPLHERAIQRAMKELQAVRNKVMGVKRPDNSISWINTNAIPMIEESGILEGLLVTFSDITELKSVQDELKTSEQRLKKLFEVMVEGVIFVKLDGQITFHNQAAQKILAIDSNELNKININNPQREIIREDGTPMSQEEMTSFLAMKEMRTVQDVVIGIKNPDNSIVWINTNASPVINQGGKLEGVVATIHDITEKKLADLNIKKITDRLTFAQEIANLGSWDLNLSNNQLFWSEETYQQFGLKPNEIVPSFEAFENFVHPSEKEKTDKYIRKTVFGGKPLSFEILLTRKDGTEWVMQAQGRAHKYDNSDTVHYIMVQQDITKRKEAEKNLLLLLKKINRHQKMLLGLSKTSQVVERSHSSYKKIYEIIGEEISKLGFHTIIVTLTNDETSMELQFLNIPHSKIKKAIRLTGMSPIGFQFPLKVGGYFDNLIAKGEIVLADPGVNTIIESLPESIHPIANKLTSIIGLGQVIYAPLTVDGRRFGLLAVIGNGLDMDYIPAIKTFATHVSIAIENTKLFNAERAAHQKMVDLTNYLQSAREEERTYMAREIHDEFGQRLTALKMDISWLSNHLLNESGAINEKVSAMSKLVDESIDLVRQVASNLRPGLLDDLGLIAALEWQAQDFSKRMGVECDLFLGVRDIPQVNERDTVLFRVFQEALTNIARHAKATKITVNLIEEESTIELKIHDNGIGISTEALNGTKSLGLMGMRERARSLGGDVEFSGIPEQGTTIRVKIPI